MQLKSMLLSALAGLALALASLSYQPNIASASPRFDPICCGELTPISLGFWPYWYE